MLGIPKSRSWHYVMKAVSFPQTRLCRYSRQRDKTISSYLEGIGARERDGLSEAAFIIRSLSELVPQRTHKLPLQYTGRGYAFRL